jgi:oxygen-independent coproporphyrinogen-3 oxidase
LKFKEDDNKKTLFLKKRAQKRSFQSKEASIYIHIPFCDSLCSFCGCTTFITKKRGPILKYLEALKKEISQTPFMEYKTIKSLHFGGGSPSMLTTNEISEILQVIKSRYEISDDAEVAIEVDPRDVSKEKIKELFSIGFNRISMGVQDFNEKTQKAINREHSFESVSELVNTAKTIGFQGVNIDLIYGLPYQTLNSFTETLEKVITLNPNRIAVFSYAHVPWMKKHQNLIKEKDLPNAEEKLKIFRTATGILTNAGYKHIGMDHFAKENDELSILQSKNKLSRNFQGYAAHGSLPLLGFGLSSISQTEDGYLQNTKDFQTYYEAIEKGHAPIHKTLDLSWDDELRRKVIMEILCHRKVDFKAIENEFDIVFTSYFSAELEKLKDLEKDGLLGVFKDKIEVFEKGKFFVRNAAMAFDKYLQKEIKNKYSKTI